MAKQPISALSLFSGIGGFCEGVRRAGFRVVGAVENDPFAAPNYRRLFPRVPLFDDDIASFLPANDPETRNRHLREFVGSGRLDLIFGGPPCQGYSQIGTREVGDPRNQLYQHVARLAQLLKPRFVLIENVQNMFLMKRGLFRERIFGALNSAGYDNIGAILLSAEDYGVPQERRRIFILATSSRTVDVCMTQVLENARDCLRRPRVTVEEAIADLPRLPVTDSGMTLKYPQSSKDYQFLREMRLDNDGSFYTARDKLNRYRPHGKIELHNHHTKEIQERRLTLIKLLKPGAKGDSLPKHVRHSSRPHKWRRLHPNRPAHTLMAQMHRDLSEWVHPEHHRWITVREALRLQSFHDGFVLGGSEWQQLKQVGNAVPPLLGYVPAMAVRLALSLADGTRRPFQTSDR
ncbi:MAG: DNA cytosine methyltransferase [Myxococcota bacterium]